MNIIQLVLKAPTGQGLSEILLITDWVVIIVPILKAWIWILEGRNRQQDQNNRFTIHYKVIIIIYNVCIIHILPDFQCVQIMAICDYVSPFSNTRAEDNKTLFCLIAVFPSLPQDSLVSDNPMTLALTWVGEDVLFFFCVALISGVQHWQPSVPGFRSKFNGWRRFTKSCMV